MTQATVYTVAVIIFHCSEHRMIPGICFFFWSPSAGTYSPDFLTASPTCP